MVDDTWDADRDERERAERAALDAMLGSEPLPRGPSRVVPLPGPRLLPLQRLGDIPDPGPTKWLVKDLWGSSAFGIVGAEPKSWKSWMTLHLGISVATGRSFLGKFEVAEPGGVLMFAAEGGKELVRARAGAICRSQDLDIKSIDLCVFDLPVLHIDEPIQLGSLKMTVELEKPRLLILDPFREMHVGDENDAALIATLLQPLRELQHTVGCAVCLVHHMGKAPGDGMKRRGGQRLRGSSALHGAVDSALYLEPTGLGESKRVLISAEHRGAIEIEPFSVRLRDQDTPEGKATWLELAQPDDQVESDIEGNVRQRDAEIARIMKAVKRAAMPGRDPFKSASGIHQAVGGRKSRVLQIVKTLIEEGSIVVDDAGCYHPSKGGLYAI